MKVKVLIYQPYKNAMQSGATKSAQWFMKFTDYNKAGSSYVFDLMNWIGGGDVLKTVNLPFTTKEAAINFATKHKFEYEVEENNKRILKPKSYAENFN